MPGVFDWPLKGLDRGMSAAGLCASVFQLSESNDAAPPVPGWEDDWTVMVMAID